MQTKLVRFKVVSVVIVLILLFPYSLSFGNEEVGLTIKNATAYYLHATMNNSPFLYIGPGRTVSFSTELEKASTSVIVQVFYAPGQGIKGSATNSFVLGGEVVDCNSRGSTCTTEPANPSSSWTITPELMVDDSSTTSAEERTQ